MLRLLLALLVCSFATSALAWPTKPVTFIVPYPPGAGTEVIPGVAQSPSPRKSAHPILIENGGAPAGSLGTAVPARATPDGHTLPLQCPSPSTSLLTYPRL